MYMCALIYGLFMKRDSVCYNKTNVPFLTNLLHHEGYHIWKEIGVEVRPRGDTYYFFQSHFP